MLEGRDSCAISQCAGETQLLNCWPSGFEVCGEGIGSQAYAYTEEGRDATVEAAGRSLACWRHLGAFVGMGTSVGLLKGGESPVWHRKKHIGMDLGIEGRSWHLEGSTIGLGVDAHVRCSFVFLRCVSRTRPWVRELCAVEEDSGARQEVAKDK